MENPRVRAVIFDIGMVLLRFDFQIMVEALKDHCSIESKDWISVLWGSGLVDAYDRGKMGTAEFIEKASKQVQFRGSPEQFLAAWSDIFSPNEVMMKRARRWKARGMSLYLLSNTCEAHVSFFETRYDIFRIFDGRIYSCREGVAKPDLDIYRRLLRRHELEPKTTLFLDDRLENVEAARRLGIHGLHYQEEGTLQAELATLGLE